MQTFDIPLKYVLKINWNEQKLHSGEEKKHTCDFFPHNNQLWYMSPPPPPPSIFIIVMLPNFVRWQSCRR